MSESKYNFSNRDLTIFFMVTFGFTIVMGIAMAFAYTKYSIGAFAQVQMYYPAIGVMIALLLNKERRKELPMKFFRVYLFFTITSILVLLIGIFVLHKDPDMYIEIWNIVGSITLVLIYFADEKKKINHFGLDLKKNMDVSIYYILLFFILYIFANILSELIFGSVKELITFFQYVKIFMNFLFIIPFFFLSQFISFLGEEYGWRYFLQTVLQQRLGKRKGVIFLGVIWGVWHLPLNLFYYSPATSLYSILNQLIVCISYSIFFGFVYMKTENIWTVSIIHFLNNYFVLVLKNSTGTNIVVSGKSVLEHLICMCVVYLPFLFTKEYRKTEEKTLNYTS